MTVNERLKYLRKEMGLTQTELSKQLNIGQTTIAAYENGTHAPQVFSLLAYADFFGCTVDYLLGRENDFESVRITPDCTHSKGEKQLIEIYQSLTEELQNLLIEQAKAIKNSKLNNK